MGRLRFLEELKKRRVVRTAVIYVGAAFAALQGVELLIDALRLPDIALTIAAVASVVGLPVALVLSWAFDFGADEPAAASVASQHWLSGRTVVAGLALLGAGVLLGIAPQYFAGSDASEDDVTLRRYEILLPESAPVEFVGSSPLRTPVRAFTITPDGNRLVYSGPSEADMSMLYIRRLDDFDVQPLAGTEGAYRPFVSPSGQQIAFFAHDELRVVPIDGGSVRTIIAAPNPRGGAWLGDDRILYMDREGAQTWSIDITRSDPQPVRVDMPTNPDGSNIDLIETMYPTPNGHGVMTTAFPGGERSPALVVWDPDTGDLHEIIQMPVYGQAVDGGLVYVTGNDLMMVDYDAEAMTVSGEPRRVGTELRRDGTLPQYVLSPSTLIYATGAPYRQLRVSRITPDWQLEDSAVAPGRYLHLSVSPDGTRLAATVLANTQDVWVFSLEDGTGRRVTKGGENHHPMWSNDGDTIFFQHSGPDAPSGIYFTSSSSALFERTLAHETPFHADEVHAGDLAMLVESNGEDMDYTVVNLQTGEKTVVSGRVGVQEGLGNLSPDRQWVALTVDASGRYEVIVQPLDGSLDPVPVSIAGGEEPRWSQDMQTLYYRYGTRLFSATIESDSDVLRFGAPEVVFEDPQWINVPGYSYWPDLANGGFYILHENQPPNTRSLRVVEGWQAAANSGN